MDISVIAIIAGNVLTIILAIALGWDFSTIIWMYWLESLIIGFYTFIGMLSKTIAKGKDLMKGLYMSFFFPVHYGGFHLGYLVFLAFLIPPTDPEAVLLGGAVFLITHGISFIKHYMTEEFDIQKEFMMPYLRIIPMHLTIIFGGMLMVFGVHVIVMIFFMALKTGADVAAHLIKHKQWNGFVRVLP